MYHYYISHKIKKNYKTLIDTTNMNSTHYTHSINTHV